MNFSTITETRFADYYGRVIDFKKGKSSWYSSSLVSRKVGGSTKKKVKKKKWKKKQEEQEKEETQVEEEPKEEEAYSIVEVPTQMSLVIKTSDGRNLSEPELLIEVANDLAKLRKAIAG